MEEIVNKVSLSSLVEFNLEDFYDNAERILIDMKDYLIAIPVGDSIAYILKEKPFRETLSQLETKIFEDKNVAISCSVDAVIPNWAYILFSLTIASKAKRVIIGNLETLESVIFFEALSKINPKDYTDAKVVIKGCSKHYIPLNSYVQVANMLKPFAKSIMYGEPCSTVPLYKRQK